MLFLSFHRILNQFLQRCILLSWEAWAPLPFSLFLKPHHVNSRCPHYRPTHSQCRCRLGESAALHNSSMLPQRDATHQPSHSASGPTTILVLDKLTEDVLKGGFSLRKPCLVMQLPNIKPQPLGVTSGARQGCVPGPQSLWVQGKHPYDDMKAMAPSDYDYTGVLHVKSWHARKVSHTSLLNVTFKMWPYFGKAESCFRVLTFLNRHNYTSKTTRKMTLRFMAF